MEFPFGQMWLDQVVVTINRHVDPIAKVPAETFQALRALSPLARRILVGANGCRVDQ
jgi:hypothetical protein